MEGDAAELSSISTQLDEITARVVSIADGYVGSDDEAIASRLYEIERTLVTTSRRLHSLVQSL